jgi:rhodanese-related sulfurtransferase
MKMNNKAFGVLIVAIILLLFGYKYFFDGPKATSADVEPSKFEELTKQPDAVILDVRSAFEFGGDRIAGARNLSFTSKNFKTEVEKFDKSKTYLVYCASGSRSAGAVNTMKAIGFNKIYNLKGGIDHWKSEGKPVTR